MSRAEPTRREFGTALGGLVIAFSMAPRLSMAAEGGAPSRDPGSQQAARFLAARRSGRHGDGVHRPRRARPGRHHRARADRRRRARHRLHACADDCGRHLALAERRRHRRQQFHRGGRRGASFRGGRSARNPGEPCVPASERDRRAIGRRRRAHLHQGRRQADELLGAGRGKSADARSDQQRRPQSPRRTTKSSASRFSASTFPTR